MVPGFWQSIGGVEVLVATRAAKPSNPSLLESDMHSAMESAVFGDKATYQNGHFELALSLSSLPQQTATMVFSFSDQPPCTTSDMAGR